MAVEARYKITATDNTKGAIASVKSGLSSLNGSVGKLTGALGVGLSVAGFVAMTKHAADVGDRIQKLNIRLGISTEALSQLRHVADTTGTSFESVVKSMQIMSRNTGDAIRGVGDATESFRALGIEISSFSKLKGEDQFELLADKLASVETPTLRVAHAMKIFGRSGAEMLQMMEQGGEGIRILRREADALGLTLTREQTDKLAAANDAVGRVKMAMLGLAQDLAIALAPKIELIANWLSDRLPFAVEFAIVAFYKLKAEALDAVDGILKGWATMKAVWATMRYMTKSTPETRAAVGDAMALYDMAQKASEGAKEAAAKYEEWKAKLDALIAAKHEATEAASNLTVGVGGLEDSISGLVPEVKKATEQIDDHVRAMEDWLYAKERFEESRGMADSMVEDRDKALEEAKAMRAALAGGFEISLDDLQEYGAGWMVLGEAMQFAGDLAASGMTNFIDASIAAMQGSKRSYGEMGKAVLKWAADTMKGLAATAAAKALYYKAEALALASNPLTAGLAPVAAAAAGLYATMAAATGAAAIALGAISANNAPSGAFMSRRDREATTGLADDADGYGREQTFTRGALTAANVNVTHIYNGPVYFGSQDLASAAGVQRAIDSGELYFAGSQ